MNIKNVLRTAYQFGKDNESGRSDKNFNDFLDTSEAKTLLILQDKTDKQLQELETLTTAKQYLLDNVLGLEEEFNADSVDSMAAFMQGYANHENRQLRLELEKLK